MTEPRQRSADSPQVRASDSEDRGEGRAFAAQAAPAVRRALNERNLRTAMATRTLIGEARGILMERLKIDHTTHGEQARAIRRYIAWRNGHTTDPKLRKVIKCGSTIERAKGA